MADLPVPVADEVKLRRRVYQLSFWKFVKAFWMEVPGAQPPHWNWHMEYLANELQEVAERVFRGEPKKHDLLVNISPGTSKSSIISILFPPWTWTRMPRARHITASHTDTLVLDLATKSRALVKGELYRQLFPEIQLREDVSAKGYYANTLGGDRFSCTVGGVSPMGMHAHFLCLPWHTRVQTDAGMIPVGRVVEEDMPVRVLGYDHLTGKTGWFPVEGKGSSPGRPVYRVTLSNGTVLEATGNHPVFVFGKGYVHAQFLSPGDEVVYAPPVCEVSKENLPPAVSLREEVQERQGVLLSEVSIPFYGREEPPEVRQGEEVLLGVRQSDFGQEREGGNRPLLQSQVQRGVYQGREQSLAGGEGESAVRGVWLGDGTGPQRRGQEDLFQKVCFAGTLRSHEGEGQPQLHSRTGNPGVFRGISRDEEVGEGEGGEAVLLVRSGGNGQRGATERASRRLEQGQQLTDEPGGNVPEVPLVPPGGSPEATEAGVAFVVAVEKTTQLPDRVYNLEVADVHNYFAEGVLVHNSLDDPTDPQKVLSQAELASAGRFAPDVLFTRKVDKAVSVFIGVMQRLRVGDPSDVLLRLAAQEGADPIKHICLPAELTDSVSPPELRERYVDGLMDPVRLSHAALRPFKNNTYTYSAQFLQSPYLLGGGMFKAEYFNNRVPAAPYRARRVRAWDRASTSRTDNPGACYTAGVLMARAPDGTYHVEDCVHGQWEPDERNKVILATAMQDRSRYGPSHEPTIHIEAEGGSSGKDAWKAIARLLAGFPVYEQRVTGSKDTRAEPWSCALAAGNVFVVDGGESRGMGRASWDVEGYVQEHLLFRPEPGKRLGRYKDQVDASAMAFSILTNSKQVQALQTHHLGRKKSRGVQVMVLSRSEFSSTVFDHDPALVVFIDDPLPASQLPAPPEAPPVELPNVARLLSSRGVRAANIDPEDHQGDWHSPVEPYGRPPADLVLSRDGGKSLWAFLVRRYDPAPGLVVLVDDDRDRALSVAMGVVDALGIPRREGVILPGAGDNVVEGEAPNRHLYRQVRSTRGLVA